MNRSIMAMRPVTVASRRLTGNLLARLARPFSDGKGKVLSEEELAAEKIYIQKMEKEKMEKLKHKAEKEKVQKDREDAQ